MTQTPQQLSKPELGELKALQALIQTEELKLEILRKNTSQVHHGQDHAKTLEGMAKLLRAYRTELVNSLARARHMKGRVSVDLERGIITEKHGEA